MNKLQRLVAILGFICIPTTAAAITLNSGEGFIHEFASLPSVEYVGYANQGGTSLYFSDDLLDAGEVVRLELFEDSFFGPVIWSNDFNSPTDSIGVTKLDIWQDFQGVILFTVLSGSVTVSSNDFQVIKDGYRFADSYQMSAPAVPEPETYAMFLAGLGVVGFMACRRRDLKAPGPINPSNHRVGLNQR